jgi:hypothetical protein
MTIAAYAWGCVALFGLVVSVGVAASRIRAALLPTWSGAVARLAECVLGLAYVTVMLEVLGSVSLLRPLVVTVLTPTVATVVAMAVGRRWPARTRDASHLDWVAVGALGMLGVVGLQWLTHTHVVLEGGFRDMDSLRYHGPFVARWVQQRGLLHLQHTSGELQETFFPATSELLSSYGVLAFGTDVATSALNLAWLALGALAAWCAATTVRGRSAAVVAFAAGMSTPLLASIEAGSAKNDVAAAALVLATAALVARALDGTPSERSNTLIVAGLAGGLAIGTKLDTLVAVSVLLVGALVVARPARRSVASIIGATAATGSYWYVRNLGATGNPLPWMRHLGPLTLPGPTMTAAASSGWSVAHYATDAHFWATTVPRGLQQSFGPMWPALLAGAVALALAAAFGAHSTPTRRVIGLACLAAGAAYLVTPFSAGGRDGDPQLFALDLRFLAPSLVLAAPLAVSRRQVVALIIGASSMVIVDQLIGQGRWPSGGLRSVVTVGAVAAVVAVGIALAKVADRPMRVGVSCAAIVLIAMVGWLVATDATSDRYARVHSGVTAAFAMFRKTHHLKIAVGGFADDYPLYGIDQSNDVQYVGVTLPDGGFRPVWSCAEWPRAIDSGGYQYVVISRSPVARQRLPAEATWTADDPAFALVLDRDVTRVFKRVGSSAGATCPHPIGAPRSSSS